MIQTQLQDQDNTSVQGFEKALRNVIFVDSNDCPRCLKPFLGRGVLGTRINVFTSYGKDQWCLECVEKGTAKNICIQESKLSKEEKKAWDKKLKKENRHNI